MKFITLSFNIISTDHVSINNAMVFLIIRVTLPALIGV